ncbi:MAG: ABC transporter ATP-binding protein [Myxococcota bacterium]
MTTAPAIEVEQLVKVYGDGEMSLRVLDGIDLRVERGEIVALCGPSGSGKSTLLNILGCLDRPTSGRYRLDGEDVSTYDRAEQASVRLRRLGFIFQSFQLLSDLTALENVILPLQYAKVSRADRKTRAAEALAGVGLGDRLEHRPSELSGGQKQRVAIARALVLEPSLLLADEPTGALDSRTGVAVLELLAGLHADRGVTIVMVTHDRGVADWAHRQVNLRDGRIRHGGDA